MNDIVRRQTSGGQVEVYNASEKLTDSTTANFEERGRFAADLLVATLTETPYVPVIDGVRYELTVSNRYDGNDLEESEGERVPDTVDEARIALAEFLAARVPGASRVTLRQYKTKYASLLDDLQPSGRGERPYKAAFDEAFVESARRREINLPSPRVGELIIARAPRNLKALTLRDRESRSTYDIGEQRHEAVTEAGRLVVVFSNRKSSMSGLTHFMSQNPRNFVRNRGGKAPGSTIVHTVEERVVDLRTRRTKV